VRWLLFLFLTFLFPLHGQAAFEFLDNGARPVAMGGAFCAVADDAHAPHYNSAGMGQVHGWKATIGYCQLFGLADLSLQNVSYIQPTRYGVLGLSAQRFGGDLYREAALGFSFAGRLRDNLFVGLSLRGLQLAIPGYGSDQTLGIDLGVLAVMAPRLHWGLSVRNLNDGRLGRRGEEMPQVLVMGFAFRPNSRLLLSTDLLQDIADVSVEKLATGGYPMELRLGQEFRLWLPLTLRLGLQVRPTRLSGGVGIRAGPFHLDYAYCSHQFLGPTHHISLSSP
jgi:hypothetical protein